MEGPDRVNMIREIANIKNARFAMDLEFIECLSEPEYLAYLSSKDYFKNENFLNYLKYLNYFTKPEYIVYVQRPIALYYLEQIQKKEFQKELSQRLFINHLTKVQIDHAKFFRPNMLKRFETKRLESYEENNKNEVIDMEYPGYSDSLSDNEDSLVMSKKHKNM